jgi:phosphodiesterase/alkaline phosphatase D-like protein
MSDPLSLRRTCPQFRAQSRLNRRGFVHAGVLGTAGLSLAQLLRTDAIAAPATAPGRATGDKRANSVILLWMRGGPSHIDMWDPKPDAPAEFRG